VSSSSKQPLAANGRVCCKSCLSVRLFSDHCVCVAAETASLETRLTRYPAIHPPTPACPPANNKPIPTTPLPPHHQGDQLISTSGVTYTRTEDYGGVSVRKGQEIVTLNCQVGRRFAAPAGSGAWCSRPVGGVRTVARVSSTCEKHLEPATLS